MMALLFGVSVHSCVQGLVSLGQCFSRLALEVSCPAYFSVFPALPHHISSVRGC